MLFERDYMNERRSGIFQSWNGSMVSKLIWVNIAFFVLNLLTGNHFLFNHLALHQWYVMHGQVWRLITCQFLHAGFFHLFCNMYGLFCFGRPVEQRLGSRRFLQMYLFSGFIGSLLWVAANWNSGGAVLVSQNAGYEFSSYAELKELMSKIPSVYGITGMSVGASGALFGVMLAAAMTFPNAVVRLIFPPVAMRLNAFVFCYGLLEVLMMLSGNNSNIAHLAHLGGILGGFLYMNRLRHGTQFSFVDWFQQRWGKRSSHGRRGPDLEFPSQFSANEIDAILEKMSAHGYESLTEEERKKLSIASERLRKS